MLQEQEYKEYCKKFSAIEKFLRTRGRDQNKVVKEICDIREYYPERMADILKEAGFFYVEDTSDIDKLKSVGSDFGLFSKKGNFILKDRYIFPVRDMLGNTVALIGWFPDEKKYVTTPSKLFSKSCMFYGMEQLERTGIGKHYYLVEGIFDCLSVRSLGFNCIAQMGINSSRYKNVMYSLFSKITAIPDNDVEGREVIGYDKWSLPSNSKYFRWTGDKSKDIDKLCNSYEYDDIKELLIDVSKEKRKVVTRKI